MRPLALGSEADIQIGADVHAIGHPTGQAWTYTKGLISQYRKDYEWKAASGSHRAAVIQTQTPINPGNSGGPLLSDDGRLIGINTFKGGGEGLNFAVALVDVEKFLTEGRAASAQIQPPACQPKQIFEGRNQQNTGDLIQYDTNCDGKADASVLKPDDQSKPILALIDSNFDNKIDIYVRDRDRDGRWDISFHDVDHDGKMDLVGYHPDGKLKPSRFEKYAKAD
jgi:S1-C subfamily serine protease